MAFEGRVHAVFGGNVPERILFALARSHLNCGNEAKLALGNS